MTWVPAFSHHPMRTGAGAGADGEGLAGGPGRRGATRKLLAEAIRQADSLCFTLGYVIGDWAAVAALEAHAQGRRYAVWFDRVEHEVIRSLLPSLSPKRRLKEQAMLLAMEPYHRLLTRRSSLALLQGMDTFNA